MSAQDIKREILDRRLERMKTEGPAFGHPVPPQRLGPLVPFLRDNGVICEVKRRSPSRGDLAPGLNAVDQARHYFQSGVKTVSILTEEDRFGGNLQDLMDVKTALPDLCVLRKDFLATRDDLEVSLRAGADAVLLIASLLEAPVLRDLYEYARSLGLGVLVEVHSPEDVEKTRPFRPRFTGINCRDLGTFRIDLAIPLMVRPLLDWQTKVVYESGIFTLQQGQWAGSNGFQGLLVGEGAVKDRALAGALARGFVPAPLPGFWQRLYGRRALESSSSSRPLVKICGLTRKEDVELADGLGADLLGFIFAPKSPRKTSVEFLRSLGGTRGLKVGVVVLEKDQPVPPEVEALLRDGSLDALQIHGEGALEGVKAHGNQAYAALSLDRTSQLEAFQGHLRVLTDAFVPGMDGGTGKVLDPQLIKAAADQRPIWLAGGLNPDNVRGLLDQWSPELIDASSGLESAPGIKDHGKLRKYFKEVKL